MAPGVSVIICCYNSSLRLVETLYHLRNQKIDRFGTEIIIVNNASTDDTAVTARRILSMQPEIDFTIVNEPENGLSHARRRGYAAAKYEYLLFCDDDNWLAENYLQVAYQTMSSKPNIGILGGLGAAVFESAEPPWFKSFAIDFAVGEQSSSKEVLSKVEEVYGAGFVIRKSYLDKLYGSGFKSILSDRKGTQLISGGDVEFCYLVKYFGFEVWYNRELKFKHYMTTQRLNWDYMKKLYAANGETNVYTTAYKYVQLHNRVPGQNLTLPFWIDSLIHKVKTVINFRAKVKHKMRDVGDAEALRYIAMKAEAMEIWNLKNDYLKIYQSIYSYINSVEKKKEVGN
jgi:glycosyltransferase involved in cell wall biosynthesis